MRDNSNILSKDFLTGLLFIIIGGGAGYIAYGYKIGTSAQMGPGYFPFILGTLLFVFGIIISARALFDTNAERLGVLMIRPIGLILLGATAFGILIRPFGLVSAIAALVVLSRFASREGNAMELIVMLIVLTVVPVLIFVYGLNIPIRLWPV